MDGELRALERRLQASGLVYKILDERSMRLLQTFFATEITRCMPHSRSSLPMVKMEATERINNLTSLMELII